jgi:ubiquinone/menaquinone biosynthesis C-methylase UbiE
VDHRDHVDLLRRGVEGGGPHWADLGSGTGAFTLALADLLGPDGTILSVDRDAGSLRQQRSEMDRRFPASRVEYRVADFTADNLGLPPLDGIVMANSLHYVRSDRQASVLAGLTASLAPGGRFILVEYDADQGNRWVPYPISLRRWPTLAAGAGLTNVAEIGRRPSRFLGSIYSAVARRPGADAPG